MIKKINPKYNTLEKVLEQLIGKDDFKYSIQRDRWNDDFIANKKCIVVKKSKRYGAKIRFIEPNTVDVLGIAPSYLIPDRGFLSYFVHLAIREGQSEVVVKTINNLKNI
ncbi:MAG: hypothetical protein V3U92_01365 [Cellulophaga sp.]